MTRHRSWHVIHWRILSLQQKAFCQCLWLSRATGRLQGVRKALAGPISQRASLPARVPLQAPHSFDCVANGSSAIEALQVPVVPATAPGKAESRPGFNPSTLPFRENTYWCSQHFIQDRIFWFLQLCCRLGRRGGLIQSVLSNSVFSALSFMVKYIVNQSSYLWDDDVSRRASVASPKAGARVVSHVIVWPCVTTWKRKQGMLRTHVRLFVNYWQALTAAKHMLLQQASIIHLILGTRCAVKSFKMTSAICNGGIITYIIICHHMSSYVIIYHMVLPYHFVHPWQVACINF